MGLDGAELGEYVVIAEGYGPWSDVYIDETLEALRALTAIKDGFTPLELAASEASLVGEVSVSLNDLSLGETLLHSLGLSAVWLEVVLAASSSPRICSRAFRSHVCCLA